MRRVGETFGVEGWTLKKRRSVEDARLVAAKLLKGCSGLTRLAIGMELGLTEGAGLGHLLRIADSRLAHSWKLRRLCAKLEESL